MAKSKICYKEKSAPWVLFLHGFGGSEATWNKQITAFGRHFNLIIPNFHDKEFKNLNILTPESLSSEINKLLDENDIKGKVFVVSMSSGSLIALAFAAQFPERVQAMVHGGGILRFRLRTVSLLWCARLLYNFVSYMLLYRFFSWLIMPGNNHKKSREIFIREAVNLGSKEFKRWVRFIFKLRSTERFIDLLNQQPNTIPSLYLMGEDDHLLLSPIQKDVSLLRTAKVAVIQNSGHVCTIEQSTKFNDLAISFLLK